MPKKPSQQHPIGVRRPTAVRRRRGFLTMAAVLFLAAIAFGGVLVLRRASSPSPLPPQPAVTSLRIAAAALGRDVAVQVYRPPMRAGAPGAVLYLFPGRGGDEQTWFNGSSGDGVGLAGVAEPLVLAGVIPPVILVSVDIDDSYGIDSSPARDDYDHGAYGTWLATELFPAVEAAVPEAAVAPSRRFVAGFSMGGHAALHLAFRKSDAIAGVAGLSPASWLEVPADRAWQVGPDPATNDPLTLAATARLGGLRVFLATGTDDYPWILASTRELAARLMARGLVVELTTRPGGHEISTWRAVAAPMLAWLLGPL